MIPKNFTEYFKSLDSTSRQAIVNELLLLISTDTDDTFSLLATSSVKQSINCPHCKRDNIRANGKSKGVQRYYCKDCKKYFRNTTGKVIFGLKKPELLPTYLHNMLMGYSIKKCAEQTNISIQTSFDWRHKVLSSFKQAYPNGFEGITESDDIFFLESSKGNRELDRKPRKRGSKAIKRGISNEQIAVVVTCDRIDNKELKVATRGRISKKDLEAVFARKLDKVETLCTDAHRSYTAFAKSNNIHHKKFNVSKGQRVKNKVYHVQNVNNTAKRLREWMKPFNGVATKYLQNYMNWFMILERIKNSNQRLKEFAYFAFAGQETWEIWKTNTNAVII